jgi:CHAD domain-containing protein
VSGESEQAMKSKGPVDASVPIDKYARLQASRRLDRFAFELRRAAKSGDADSIHDLRVSIRRLTQCLKIFRQFLPAKQSKKVRRQLRQILKAAAQVRNRDVALELLREAGLKPDSAQTQRLCRERKQAQDELEQVLSSFGRREFSAKWRARLGL